MKSHMEGPKPKINPKFKHHCDHCTCLGEAVINGTGADLFVCSDTVIARFGDEPDDYEASHLSQISAFSSPYLLTAFRLYLDAKGEKAERARLIHAATPLRG